MNNTRLSPIGKTFAVLLLAGLLAPSATALGAGEDAAAAKAARITYDDHVSEIFRSQCFKCHNQDRKKGGLALNTYGLTMEGGSSGKVVKPGEPDSSRLFALIAHLEEPHMPPKGGKLADGILETVRKWIAGGAPENKSSKIKLPTKPKLELSVSEPTAKPEGPPPMPRGLSLEPVLRTQQTSAVTAMATSPWAPLLAVAGQKQVLLYNTDTSQLAGVLPFPEGSAHILKFSRNAGLLLAGGGRGAHSGKVVVWSVRTGERIVEIGDEYDSVLAADISSDHSMVALGGSSKMLRIYSTSDGELLHDIKKHTNWIFSLEFSPDGVLLASGDRNGGLHVWESFTGREYLALGGHGGPVTSVSWRGDSNILASSSEDSTIRLWEMENGRQIRSWNAHGGGTLAMQFHRNGQLVSCGRDRVAKLWDQNGKQLRAFEAFSDLALRVAVDHNGKRVIAGDWNGEVRMWNAADGKRLAALPLNPVSLIERSKEAETALAAIKAGHAKLAAEQDRLLTAARTMQAEVEKTAASAKTAEAAAAAAAGELKKNRELADSSSAGLKDALAILARLEEAHGKLTAAEKKDEAQLKASAQALAAAQGKAAGLAAEVSRALEQRAVSRAALDDSSGKLSTARGRLNQLTPQAKSAGEAASSQKAALDQAAAGLKAANARSVKWKAAIEIDKALKVLAQRRKEHNAALIAVEESKLTARDAALRIKNLQGQIKASAEETRKAAESAAAAAKSLLEKAAGSSSKAAEIIAGTETLELSNPEQAGKLITDLKTSSGSLADALASSLKAWEESNKQVQAVAARGAELTSILSKELATLKTMGEKLKQATAEAARAETAVNTAKAAWEKWTGSFETASQGSKPPARVVANK
jgi:mono/diheme cytochrome c family protein